MNKMKTYIFFFDKEVNDDWSFKIKANNHEHAFNLAYNEYGPQIEMMYCKEIKD